MTRIIQTVIAAIAGLKCVRCPRQNGRDEKALCTYQHRRPQYTSGCAETSSRNSRIVVASFSMRHPKD